MRAAILVMIASACSYPKLPPLTGDNVDAPSVNPSLLSLDDAGPELLYEGQGEGGSRPVVLAITGQNFTPSATVRVFATGSETPMITVNNNDPMIATKVSSGSDVLAVSVVLPVDPMLPANLASPMQDIPLTIEVTQPAGGTMVIKTLTGKLTLRTLPELTVGTVDSASLRPMYSLVDISGPLQFASASARPRALIRSASAIRLQTVIASAAGNAPGPGGAAGGGSGQPGNGGTSGGGAGNAIAGGGGGGLASAGQNGGGMGTIPGGAPNGDPLVSDYATGNLSAGGGGGAGSTGGGGGGTVELTAAGDIHVGAITAVGGMGSNGGTTSAGGGAGGIVVIRAGGTAMLEGTISATGGAAGTGGVGFAGAGSTGRTRIDAPTITLALPTMIDPPYHRGASWDPATPLTTKTSPFAMKLFGTVADKFDVVVLDGAGGASSPAFTADFGNATMITVRPALQPGFNRVCVTRNGGSVTVIEATNCIDVVYLP